MRTEHLKTFALTASRAVFALTLAAGMLFAAGCGGGGGGSTTSQNPGATPSPTPSTGSAASAQVRFGDAPADSVISFEVSVTALTLTPSNGGTPVAVPVGANNRIELTHASGKFEPFSVGNLPQGTFSAANLTLANSELTFLNSTGLPVHINGPASAQATITLNPALTIGSSPLVLNIDVNVANSITTNGSTITGISFGPTSFAITAKAPGAQAEQEDDDGEIEDVRGTVTAASSSSFTLQVGQTGSAMNFNFDSTTKFSDGVTATTLLNQIVVVEGFTQADGSLFAKEVEGLESSTGSELEGLIRSISGTLLTVTSDDGVGAGMDPSKIGADFTVDITGLKASKFKVDGGNGFGSLIPASFIFDDTTIHEGQRIEVESNNPVPAANGSITADKIKLQQQGISGSVSNLAASGATFDVTLASDSALAVISGQTLVHVTVVSATDNRFGAIANGNNLRVRGLLFWNGTSWNMVARRIQ
ncbi:MAG: DUF5666 domain-containing protein [Actinomycetota bacterium]